MSKIRCYRCSREVSEIDYDHVQVWAKGDGYVPVCNDCFCDEDNDEPEDD